jgi:ABC-type branched-subunit amino acid transport system substrate-binding protein
MDTMVGPRNPNDFSKDLVNDLPKDLPRDLATPLPTGPRPSRSQTSSSPTWGTTRRTAVGLILGAPLLGACAGSFSNPFNAQAGPSGPAAQPVSVGTGQVKIGLILPLSASGNAGVAAQSMKNAAEMALAEFQNPNIQLLIKDDGGNPQGAQQGTQQAIDEGAEMILGPLFALSVPAAAQLTRAKGVSVIAFSTDSSVAGRGV